ncbi:MAG: hypothetical protein J5838_06620 [Desulfovibrio sp.]|nr:hypothetical protein [Desulfovibrio sp.]
MSQTVPVAASSNAYSAVPVYNGTELAAQQNLVETGSGAMAATDQQRAIAEVQAALVIAAGRPRNELRARDRLLAACGRVGLASVAMYEYKRGGSSVSGPSIRLAETAARAWGNMNYGFREVARRPGESECEAFAWDLETNTKAVRQFTVRHRRDTKKGGYDLTDERDIYELLANHAQRRVRATILEIIPGDIIEDAVAECEKTVRARVGDTKEAARNLVEAFAKFGISREAIEKKLGQHIDSIEPGQIVRFRKIYTSIKDGMSKPADWFDLDENPQTEHAAPAEPAKQAEQEPAPKPTPAKPAASPAPKPAERPAAEERKEEAPKPAPAQTPAPGKFRCPKGTETPIWVTESDCSSCNDRNGCPEWSAGEEVF